MRTSDFDFELPADRIALRPARPRDSARLMLVPGAGAIQDRRFADLPDLLRAGDLLVFNDTRVIPARLFGVRAREGSSVAVEATLHQRLAPDRWSAFMRPGKRLRPGDPVRFGAPPHEIDAVVEAKGEDGELTLRFALAGAALDAAVAGAGIMPLPPYIAQRRAEDAEDAQDYQTVYARADGSVAAPTAGLHFTPDLLARLDAKGVERRFVTLHVGAGTFMPVKAEAVADHRMHAETGEIDASTAAAANAALAEGRRVIAVGTTALRLLEAAAEGSQGGKEGGVRPFRDETRIFITPGHRFRTAVGLLTNFHLPRSTLLMLVSAFAGVERTREAYAHAVAGGYRFYSYGDAGLWWRGDAA